MNIAKDFRALLCTISLITLVSCSNNVQEVELNEDLNPNSSFFVEEVSSSSENISQESNQLWDDLKDTSYIHFKTCLKEKGFGRAVIGEKFIVKFNGEQNEVISDTNGCLAWSQIIKYNFLNQETYFSKELYIKGLGHHTGEALIPLAINPWLSSSPTKDLRFREVPQVIDSRSNKLESLDTKNLEEYENKLQFSRLSYELYDSKFDAANNQQLLKYKLVARPFIAKKGIDNNLQEIRINRGLVDLEVNFFVEKDEQLYFLTKASIQNVTINNNIINENFEIGLDSNNIPNQNNFIKSIVNIIPKNAPEYLQASQVIKEMESLNKETSTESTLVSINMNQFESFANNDKNESEPSEIGFNMDKITLSMGSIVNNNKYDGAVQIYSINARICLLDNVGLNNSRSVRDAFFKVTSDHEEKLNIDFGERKYKTDESGCLNAQVYSSYNIFGTEKLIPLTIKVEGVSNQYAGAVNTRNFKINPWNPADFSYDLKFQSTIPAIEPVSPKVVFDQVNVTQEGLDISKFALDKRLNLSLNKKYRINISPKIIRENSYQRDMAPKTIHFGKVKITTAIVSPTKNYHDINSPNFEEFKFLSSTSKEVDINENGTINDIISLPFLIDDTRDLRFINSMLIKVEPIGELSNIAPSTYLVPFYSNYNTSFKTKEVADLDSIITKMKETDKFNFMNKVGHYPLSFEKDGSFYSTYLEAIRKDNVNNSQVKVKHGDLTMVNQSQPVDGVWIHGSDNNIAKYFSRINKDELRILVTSMREMPKSILKKFCRHFHPLPKDDDETAYSRCVDNPVDEFTTMPMNYIEKLISKKNIDVNNETLTIGKANYISSNKGKVFRGTAFFAAYGDRSFHTEGEQDSKHFSKGLGYEFFIPFLGGVDASYKVDKSMFSMEAKTTMQSSFKRNYTQQADVELEFDQLSLEFFAEIKRCVLVSNKYVKDIKVHLCENQNKLQKIRENWYFIGDTRLKNQGIISSTDLPEETALTQILRGRSFYEKLWGNFREEDRALVLKEIGEAKENSVLQTPLTEVLKKEYKELGVGLPGVIIPF